MSSSSECSLAELPSPYHISSAVSRALHMDPSACHSSSSSSSSDLPRRGRSLSYPTTAPSGYYDFPAHGAAVAAAYHASESENYSATYYHQTSSPYYFAAIPGSAPPEGGHFIYPHPYSSIHPAEQQVQMEIEAWSESTAMSICSGSGSGDLLESQVNMEQLDQFCKYIDSSGDEEFIGEKGESSMLGSADNEYGCFSMTGSPPPKKKRRSSSCALSMKSYYEDDKSTEEHCDWGMELENASMWREFDSIGTEMVITKAGRSVNE